MKYTYFHKYLLTYLLNCFHNGILFIESRQLINLYESQKTNNIHYLRFSFMKKKYILSLWENK